VCKRKAFSFADAEVSHPTTRRLNVWEESDSQSGIRIQGGDGGDQWRSRGQGCVVVGLWINTDGGDDI
jgi:hypothetical protein